MVITKDMARQHVGKWVQCRSVYGMHQGMLYKVTKSGVILIHHTQLASGAEHQIRDFAQGTYDPAQRDEDFEAVRLMMPMPYPGMYIPYAGMFGMWPGVGFVI